MKTNDDGKDRKEMKIMKRDREEEIINGMKTMLKKTERSEVKLMEYKEVTGNENDDGRPREVSTRWRQTRNSQVRASKNFLSLPHTKLKDTIFCA